MNYVDFKKIIAKFAKYPISGRKLFVWVGSKETLISFLPMELTKEVDLIKLREPIEVASTHNAAKTIKSILLHEAKTTSPVKTQQILIFINAFLMARYRISLTPLYDYYLGDRTMAILQIPKVSFQKELPKYIKYDPLLPLSYFKQILPEEHKENIILEEKK